MPTLNQDNFDDVHDRLTDVENNMSSINQVSALMDLVTTYNESVDDSIEELQDRLDDAEGQIEALLAFRTQLRNEVVEEAASNPSSDGVTWVVTHVYDPDAPFMVFSGVTRVLDSNLTYNATKADDKEFESSISLSAPVRVFYFKSLSSDS